MPLVAPDPADPARLVATGLSLSIDVTLRRTKRRTCPVCRNVRVLYQLVAGGRTPTLAAVTDGPLLCGPCGGIR